MNLAAAATYPLLAALPPHPSVVEGIKYQINGLIVVFLALGTIWGVMELIGGLFKAQEARNQLARKQRAEPTVSPSSDSNNTTIPGEIAATISAAVVIALQGRSHRIHAIAAHPDVDWAREGRRQIFASHKVR
jgi:hypothetical protein